MIWSRVPMNKKSSSKNKTLKKLDPTVLIAIISAVTTIIAVLIQSYGSFITRKIDSDATALALSTNAPKASITPSPTTTQLVLTRVPTAVGTLAVQAQVSTLENEVSLLQTQVAINSDLRQELDAANNRLNELEAVIETSPSEAMAYVVLRKELDEARSDIKDLDSRLTNSWSQNIPLYGLVITVGFTLISLLRSDRRQLLESLRNINRNRENQRFE